MSRRLLLPLLLLPLLVGGGWLLLGRAPRPDCDQQLVLRQRLHVPAGSNQLQILPWRALPRERGWITGMRADFTRLDGTHSPVTELHIHHVSWGPSPDRLMLAVGQELNPIKAPPGFGWRFLPGERWTVVPMIHNYTRQDRDMYLVLHFDWVPDVPACRQKMRQLVPLWMDVTGGSFYPAFDVPYRPHLRRDFMWPQDARFPRGQQWRRRANHIDIREPLTLIGATSHLHPGGRYADLWLVRRGKRVRLFRSRTRYFQRGIDGNPTWDLIFERTRPDWRVALQPGDRLEVTAAFEANRAAWAQQMALLPMAAVRGDAGGVDPFQVRVDGPGLFPHGSLSWNRDTPEIGRLDPRYADSRRLADGPRVKEVTIRGFAFSQGDLAQRGVLGRPPVLAAGSRLQFYNRDARQAIPHSVTACRSPCRGHSGALFPLANGWPAFDSGDLGFGRPGMTSTVNRDRWSTPRLRPGTYTYFCRLHPDMRGAFRVRRAR